MSRPTLLDIAKANGSDAVVGLIDEVSQAAPEVKLGHARTINGISYKTLVRIALPTVGFRNANEGTAASKGRYENRTVETFIFDPRWECDKAIADRYEDGPEAYIALEASAIVEASMQHLGKVFYYGRGAGGDAKGFPGLLAAYDSTNMLVDAGGTTADTGSSVWAVKWGPRDVSWVWGNNGSLELADPRVETLYDASSNPFTGYVQNLMAYPGLQVGSTRSIGRISKLTADSGKGLTDDRIAELLSKFATGVVPDVLLMTRRSLEQLRKSRTATNATGAPAPTPTESHGVPIQVTDSILNTEALTL
jgi:hypothetical protein